MTAHSHKKAIALGAAAFVATLIVGIGIGRIYTRYEARRLQLGGQPEEVISADADPSLSAQGLAPVDAEGTLAVANQRMAYDQALRRYRSQSIHVDENCRAVPAKVTVFSGARIMLDNQSGQEKVLTLSFDREGFVLAPHHFVITNVPDSGTFSVSCDNHKAVASVTVEKIAQ